MLWNGGYCRELVYEYAICEPVVAAVDRFNARASITELIHGTVDVGAVCFVHTSTHERMCITISISRGCPSPPPRGSAFGHLEEQREHNTKPFSLNARSALRSILLCIVVFYVPNHPRWTSILKVSKLHMASVHRSILDNIIPPESNAGNNYRTQTYWAIAGARRLIKYGFGGNNAQKAKKNVLDDEI